MIYEYLWDIVYYLGTLGRVDKIKNVPILMRHESKIAF